MQVKKQLGKALFQKEFFHRLQEDLAQAMLDQKA